MAHRIINLNTADPYIIGNIINDYFEVRDHKTLKSIGLTQTIIDELQEIYDRTAKPDGRSEVPGRFVSEYVFKRALFPPNDMDIPGDLWKIIIKKEVTNTEVNSNRHFFRTTHGGIRRLSDNPGLRIPVTTEIIKYSELYKNVLTAPSFNRFLTLFDSYGGWQSYMMRVFLTISRRPEGGIGWAPGEASDRQNSGWWRDVLADDGLEIKNIFIERGYLEQLNEALSNSGSRIKNIDDLYNWKLPYGSYNSDETLFDSERMALVRAGDIAGYNYELDFADEDVKQRLGANGGRQWELEAYGYTFAPPEKLQVSAKMRELSGGISPLDTTKERPIITKSTIPPRMWKYSVWRRYMAQGASYNNPDDPNFPYWIPGLASNIIGGIPNRKDGFIELGSGTRKQAEISEYEPVIEFPRVYDGTTFRPLRHPFGQLVINDNPEPAIQFLVEMAQHFEAIATWVEAGMPCDWPEWKNYLTPDLAATLARQQAELLDEATRYIPTTVTSATPPTGPKPGDQWFDTTTGKTKVWRETNPSLGFWVDA